MGILKKYTEKGVDFATRNTLSFMGNLVVHPWKTINSVKDFVADKVWQVIQYPVNIVEKTVFSPIETITNAVRTGASSALDSMKTAANYLDKKFQWGIGEEREKKKKINQKKTDIRGARWDRAVERAIASIHDNIQVTTADEHLRGNQIWFKDRRKGWQEKLKTVSGHLKHEPLPKRSDDAVEKQEKTAEKMYLIKVDRIQGINLSSIPLNSADHLIAEQIKARFEERLGLSFNHELSDLALKQCVDRSQNKDEIQPPHHYLRYKPVQREMKKFEDQENLPTSEEELNRMIKKEDRNNGRFDYEIEEKRSDYLDRIRATDAKRSSLQYETINFAFDLNQEDYPYDGKVDYFFNKIRKDPRYKEAMKGKFNSIGIGIYRTGNEIFVQLIVEVDPSQKTPALSHIRTESLQDKDWFRKIPKVYRDRGHPYKLSDFYFGIPLDAPAHKKRRLSGYTLYQAFLFFQRLDELGQEGLDVNLVQISLQPQDPVGKHVYDTLAFQVKVGNQEPEQIKLINRTTIAVIAKRSASDEGGGQMTGGTSMNIDAYFQKLRSQIPEKKETHLVYQSERGRGEPPRTPPRIPEERY